MRTTVNFFRSLKTFIKGMSRKEKSIHIFICFGVLIMLNLPQFDFTMGVFYSSDYSLLGPSLYGLFLNGFLFYGVAIFVKEWFRKNIKTFLYKFFFLFLIISGLEMILDTIYFYLFNGSIESWIILDVFVGTLLLNAFFFLIPGLVYSIVKDWKSVELTDHKSKIVIKDGTKEVFLESSDIYFVKSDGNYAVYHTKNGKIMVRESLASILKELPEEFLRSHRSFIVNSRLIEKKSYDQLEIANHKIPIGRTYSEIFK